MNGTAEFRLIMLGISVLCGLSAACSVWPVIDVVMSTGLLGAFGLVAGGYLVRMLVREVRFRAYLRTIGAPDLAPAALTAAHRPAAARTGVSR